MTDIDRGGEAFRIGAAVALDDDAVEPEKDPAIGSARIHALAQLRESLTREQIADAWCRACCAIALRRYWPIWRAVPSAVLSAMLPAKPSVTTTSTLPWPMSSPSTKPTYSRSGICRSRRMRPASRTGSRPLTSSTPILRSPTVGRFEAKQDARRRRAHDREIDEMLGVRADRGADIEHDQFAAQGRPQCRDRRPLDAREHFEIELRHRHQGAGIAGRYRHVGFVFLTASIASHIEDLRRPWRSAWLGLSSIRTAISACTMREADCSAGCLATSGSTCALLPKNRNVVFRAARQRQFGAGHDHGRAMVSPHRIESNADHLRHCLTAILDLDPIQRARIAVPIFVIAHDPFRKPGSTFRNHAPGPNKGG